MSTIRITDDGPNGAVVQNRCDTKIKVYKGNYLWVIHDYSFYKATLTKGLSLKSPVFFATVDDGCKWYLHLYPNGRTNSENDNSSLYLFLDRTSECSKVFGKFKFLFFDENQKKYVSIREDAPIGKFEISSNISWGQGYDNFIKTDYKLASNDKLMIYCEVAFTIADPATNTLDHFNSIKCQSKIPKFCLYDQVEKLFKNKEFTDVVISVNGKEFRAHKLILIARSPVFAAMFKYGSMKENSLNKIEIFDFREQVVEEMLNYIYTNKLENLEKLADGLLAAAEKYGLNGLKELSQDALIARLSVENAIDTLILADLYQAQKLKSTTIRYIIKKSAVLMKTTDWKNFSKHDARLAVEIYNAVTDELHSGTKKSFVGKNWGILKLFSRKGKN